MCSASGDRILPLHPKSSGCIDCLIKMPEAWGRVNFCAPSSLWKSKCLPLGCLPKVPEAFMNSLVRCICVSQGFCGCKKKKKGQRADWGWGRRVGVCQKDTHPQTYWEGSQISETRNQGDSLPVSGGLGASLFLLFHVSLSPSVDSFLWVPVPTVESGHNSQSLCLHVVVQISRQIVFLAQPC